LEILVFNFTYLCLVPILYFFIFFEVSVFARGAYHIDQVTFPLQKGLSTYTPIRISYWYCQLAALAN